jgi:quinol monooxygenase YgiN
MIVVIARLTVAPGQQEQFLSAAAALIEATRAEPGCNDYTLLRDTEHPERFVITEEWADSDAFRTHVASPHLAAWREQSAAFVTGQSVTVHTVEKTRVL